MLTSLADMARRRPWLRAAVLACRRCRARAIDATIGISAGLRDDPHGKECCDPYSCDAINYSLARQLLRSVALHQHDVVYDLGCGAGRIICLAARQPVQRCVGVEISSTLAEAARHNARRLRGRRSPIDIIHADAASLDYRDGTVFLMYNPFGEQTMRRVLSRIEQSLHDYPRNIRIGYGNPMHEDVLEHCGWLQRYATYHSLWYARPSSFWQHVAPLAHQMRQAREIVEREQPAMVEAAA